MLSASVQGQVGAFRIEVAFEVGAGPLVLLGPNGAGKTRILRMLLGVDAPIQGRIQVGEATLFDSRAGVSLPVEARRLGYLPQSYALFPHLSVLDNVAFALPGAARARREKAREMLAALELSSLADRRPGSLSGGEAQRVALARALSVEPRALLLDEPLAALDVGARRATRTFLAGYLRQVNLPSVVVTHDASDVAELADSVLVVEAGRVVQRGSWADLVESPASPFVSEFTALHRAAGRAPRAQ